MKPLKPLCTYEELQEILEQKHFSRDDMHKIASTSKYTLLEALGEDFSNEEVKEIHVIESKNLMQILNAFYGVLFNNDWWPFKEIRKTSTYLAMIKAIKEEYKEEEQIRFAYLSMMIKYLLTFGDIEKESYSESFQGKIPKKMFSFRQMRAHQWYDDYVLNIIALASLIYSKTNNANMTMHYVMATTAYYLTNSQTYKYYQKSSDASFTKTYLRIIIEFIKEVEGDNDLKRQIKDKVFYKDI